jgi:glycosyltransferase involved in cell wall biosynthesis
MLVQHKYSEDSYVFDLKARLKKEFARWRYLGDKLPLALYPQRTDRRFSSQWLPENNKGRIEVLDPDIINLHWVGDQFLRIETLASLRQPIVWTLHDMWPFTGGCHHSEGCDNYTDSCGACHLLGSSRKHDASHWIWRRKVRAWNEVNLTIVTLNSWMASCAKSSSLFRDKRIEIIPNGLDIERYKPVDKKFARSWLGLPQNKKLILFGSLMNKDPWKGMYLLRGALQELSETNWRDQIEVMVFGSPVDDQDAQFGFEVHHMGRLHDDSSLALVYSAADVFVSPSTQDNLPNTVMEAMACGTPCVAFDVGGLPDMIDHHLNGYLAQSFEIEDLARGIVWTLEDQERPENLSEQARKKALREYDNELQANKYRALYSKILNSELR